MMPFSPKPLTRSLPRPPGLSRTQLIEVGGLAAIPHLSGALYLPDERVLLVADLHLEQGASLARRGVHVPPYDTAGTLDALEDVLAETKPWRLILLGDSFHDAVAHEALDARDLDRLRSLTARIETVWISGNHDPEAHGNLGGFCVAEVALGRITLRHIPQRVLKDACEVSGHLHPGAAIEQRGIRLRAKCFVSDGRRLILPAFGRYTGALNVRSEAFRGLFDEEATQAWMIGNGTLHRFPFKRLS